MDIGTWIELLGRSQDDPAVKGALAAAGLKKPPKLDKDNFRVHVELKGQGMSIVMMDEAYLKKLEDQDIGEGPLILTTVDAYLRRKKSGPLYKGKLPYNLAPDMTRDDVRRGLGSPTQIDDETPADSWSRDGFEVVALYTQDLTLRYIKVGLPPPA